MYYDMFIHLTSLRQCARAAAVSPSELGCSEPAAGVSFEAREAASAARGRRDDGLTSSCGQAGLLWPQELTNNGAKTRNFLFS